MPLVNGILFKHIITGDKVTASFKWGAGNDHTILENYRDHTLPIFSKRTN
jgi:hypothetical protein